MTFAFDLLLALSLLWSAWRTLATPRLDGAIVLFIVFGLLMSLAWARLAAPDIGLAEAAIGAGLTGALLLDAYGVLRRRRAERHETRHAARCTIVVLTTRPGVRRRPRRLAMLELEMPAAIDLRVPVAAHLADSGVTHPVTAVLLNYRGYDTLARNRGVAAGPAGHPGGGRRRTPAPPSRAAHPVLQALARLAATPAMIGRRRLSALGRRIQTGRRLSGRRGAGRGRRAAASGRPGCPAWSRPRLGHAHRASRPASCAVSGGGSAGLLTAGFAANSIRPPAAGVTDPVNRERSHRLAGADPRRACSSSCPARKNAHDDTGFVFALDRCSILFTRQGWRAWCWSLTCCGASSPSIVMGSGAFLVLVGTGPASATWPTRCRRPWCSPASSLPSPPRRWPWRWCASCTR
jgi:energy-converting hydrogenase B subunit D